MLCSGGGFCLVHSVKSIPWLLLVNRFTVLNIEEVNTDICEPIDTSHPSTPDRKVLPWKPKWEKRLPKQLSANTLDAHRTSIILSIEISTTDTSEMHSVKALLDSRAMGNFIDKDFVHIKGISTWSISHPILVYNMDSSPNKAGQISEVVNVVLHYKIHLKRTLFTISSLLSQSLDDLGTTRGECLERTWWSSPLDSTTYLYYFTSGCTPITTRSHVLPEHSMIIWPCYVI